MKKIVLLIVSFMILSSFSSNSSTEYKRQLRSIAIASYEAGYFDATRIVFEKFDNTRRVSYKEMKEQFTKDSLVFIKILNKY